MEIIFEILQLITMLVGFSYVYKLGARHGTLLVLNQLGDWNSGIKSEFMKYVLNTKLNNKY